MNDFKICLHNHFIFNGFTVQPGMIFGLDMDGNSIITNGKQIRQGYYIYTDAGSTDFDFDRIYITQLSHPKIYTKIQKALRQRERKGLDGVSYRTHDQLILEHYSRNWDEDTANQIFNDISIPVGRTCQTVLSKNANSTAKYNSMKERCTLTQGKNTCKYNSAGGYVTII